jgi:U3 small nucleolar RNA-associated protein 19
MQVRFIAMNQLQRIFLLLTPSLFTAYHSLLPAQLVAAFIKRMTRLGLSSPPASIVIIIPFIYNLLKRHPTCMQMIHAKADSEINDHYDFSEQDPMKSNALQSSLWEIKVKRKTLLLISSSCFLIVGKIHS